MCESYDVLRSTYQSAPAMTYTFCDYGGGSMGNGIRKFADEMIDTGIKKGRSVGVAEGAIIATIALGVLNLTVWGVKKIRNNKRIENQKQLHSKTENTEKEEHCDAEVQSDF